MEKENNDAMKEEIEQRKRRKTRTLDAQARIQKVEVNHECEG